jgi:hypothetical protein
MIIKYFHTSEPDVEKTYDTVKSLKNNPFFHVTQEEFDKMEIDKMKNDIHIISYKVMEV